jgi:type IV secretion system protein VirB9
MKRYKVIRILIILSIIITSSSALSYDSPVAIDSRIKTLIFSENEVFRLVVHYGYQTSIEFQDGEEVQSISVGNNYAWTLTPLGRRLFIKPLEDNILTNMTILTNQRAYQFEIQSKPISNSVDEELVYVVRFFYPGEGFDNKRPDVAFNEVESIPTLKPYNFNYTLTGPDKFAPLKVFDDGINTFFKFDPSLKTLPTIATKAAEGAGDNLEMRQRGEYIVVNTISKEFVLNLQDEVVSVYNENKS